MKNNPIFVTQPAMPPLEEFNVYLKQIWDSKILTNNGPFHQKFESELSKYLGVKYISLFANGTLALLTALQALRISGEVITTPFSFIATTHSLWWNNIKPVFADIEPEHFTIDPDRIEAAITPLTTAIMPVHVYGYPCKIDQIQKIADKYGLKVIYDAAHAFGVKINGESILNFGDLSILSFHATKPFNTFEGGAIICHDEKTKNKIDFLKNFGFKNEIMVVEPGINAKMNEIQAAFGLLQLKYIDKYIIKRKLLTELYRENLENVSGIKLSRDILGVRHNYSYFPILVEAEEYGETRDWLYEYLKRNNIFGRRYFYPLISQFPPYNKHTSAREDNLPVAIEISRKVICLPLFPDLQQEDLLKICKIIQYKK